MENKNVNERALAVNILLEITEQGGYNNIVLRKTLNRNNAMNQTQKAFVTELVNGTLRNLILLDYIIDQFAGTKTVKMKPLILSILRTGVYQIKFLDKIPNSAACNEAVKLCKKFGFINLSGFVNGVLRNIARNIEDIRYPDENTDPVRYLSVTYSYPEWLIEQYLNDFERNYGLVKEMLAVNNMPPQVTVCVNKLKTDKQELMQILEKEGVGVSTGVLAPDALNLSGTSDLTRLNSFQDGYYHIMDESAMLSVYALCVKPGQTVLDLCAAPGGKSFFSAFQMQNQGLIVAGDLHEHRVNLIEEGAKRLGVEIIQAQLKDAAVFDPKDEEKADCLMLDVPCSGLGLVRKKPDIKFVKTKEDVYNLAQLQRDILAASWQAVKKGGVLVYSACTTAKEETVENMYWFLENFPFELDSLTTCLPGGERFATAKEGYITISPADFGSDGFFIARFIRKV